MGVGSGGSDAIKMLQRQQREADRRAAARREARTARRKERSALEPREGYLAEPADALEDRARSAGRRAVVQATAAVVLLAALEVPAVFFEGARIAIGWLTIPTTATVTLGLGLVFASQAVAASHEHRRRFPADGWPLARPTRAIARVALGAHLAAVAAILVDGCAAALV